jgi:hypothetical protein
MKRLAVLPLMALMFLIPAADASAKIKLSGPAFKPWMTRCVNSSLVPTPTVSMTVIKSNEPGLSWTRPYIGEQIIALYDLSGSGYACNVLMHEIGHVYDWAMLTQDDRRYEACQILREASPNLWWGYMTPAGLATGAGEDSPIERFAEAYRIAAKVTALPAGAAWLSKPGAWIRQSTGYVSYGLTAYFDKARLIKFRSWIKTITPRRAPDLTSHGQMTPVAEC